MVLTLFLPAKKKALSVILVDGFLLNNQVRAEQCKGCDSTTKLLVHNLSNPNLVLYGCSNHKCKQNLIRVEIDSANENQAEQDPMSEIFIENIIRPQTCVAH